LKKLEFLVTRNMLKAMAGSRPGKLFNRTFLRFPVAISASMGIFRYTTADALVQISENKGRKSWDYRRSWAFFIFGVWIGVFFGKTQAVWYTKVMATLRRLNLSKISASAGIALFDSTLLSVTMYFLPFYAIQDYCNSHQFNFGGVLQKSWSNATTDMTASLSFHGPVITFNMMFVPPHLRPIFINSLSWLWSLNVSKMRGRYNPGQNSNKKLNLVIKTYANQY